MGIHLRDSQKCIVLKQTVNMVNDVKVQERETGLHYIGALHYWEKFHQYTLCNNTIISLDKIICSLHKNTFSVKIFLFI